MPGEFRVFETFCVRCGRDMLPEHLFSSLPQMGELQQAKHAVIVPSSATSTAGREGLRQPVAFREAGHIQFAHSMARPMGRTGAEQFGEAPEPYVRANVYVHASCILGPAPN